MIGPMSRWNSSMFYGKSLLCASIFIIIVIVSANLLLSSFSIVNNVVFALSISTGNYKAERQGNNTSNNNNLILGVIIPGNSSSSTNNNNDNNINNKLGYEKLYGQLVNYIESKLNAANRSPYSGKVIITNSSDNMTDLLNHKKVDFYIASSLTSALVDNRTSSKPILSMLVNGIPEYHSVLVTRKDTGIKQIFLPADLTGKKLGVTDISSTEGYLLPKAYLIKNKNLTIDPQPQPPLNSSKTSINYVITGNEDNTINKILQGKLDGGAISSITYEQLPSSVKSKLKVIGQTFSVPTSLLSYRSGLDNNLIQNLKAILLYISADDPEGKILLNKMNPRLEFRNYEVGISSVKSNAASANNTATLAASADDNNNTAAKIAQTPTFSNLTRMALLANSYSSCNSFQLLTVKALC